MAVTINMKDAGFFKHVFHDNPELIGWVGVLAAYGITFDVSLYSISTVMNGKQSGVGGVVPTIGLGVSTSSLMKLATNPDAGVMAAKQKIAAWVEDIVANLTPEVGNKKSLSLPPGATLVEPAPGIVAPKPSPKVVSSVMKLIDAEAIGQAVHGTSAGSVYHLIAANDRVKVAARLQGTNLSLRVEAKNPTSAELTAIEQSGVSWHGTYGSAHMDTSGLPPTRVLGAFVYGCGIKFDRVLPAGETLK